MDKRVLRVFVLLIVLLVLPLSSAKSFIFLEPTPEDMEIIRDNFVIINVSVIEDTPAENCFLILEFHNITRKLGMEYNNHFCQKKIDNLINKINYSFTVTTEDIYGKIDSSNQTSFFVNMTKVSCNLASSDGIRSCILNRTNMMWERPMESFLIIIMLGSLIFIVSQHFRNSNG